LFKKPKTLNLGADLFNEFKVVFVELYGNPLFSGTDHDPKQAEIAGVGKGNHQIDFRSGRQEVAGFDENTPAADVKDILPEFQILGAVNHGAEVVLPGVFSFFWEVVHGGILDGRGEKKMGRSAAEIAPYTGWEERRRGKLYEHTTKQCLFWQWVICIIFSGKIS
jgi:hypothetical protein